MSAFIVSRKYIAAIAKAAHVLLGVNALEVADALSRENHESFNYRYDEDNGSPARFETAEIESAPDLSGTPYALLAAVNCLDYQSCERPGWDDSRACDILIRLSTRAQEAGAVDDSQEYYAARLCID
jgi:hypothetical protein